MKKVFSNSAEVSHIWASQEQEEGRAGNLSFVGTSLFSYNWYEIAQIKTLESGETVCFIRDYSYSSYTGRHLKYARRAIRNLRHIEVHGETQRNWHKAELINHEANICALLEDLKESKRKFQNCLSTYTAQRYFSNNQYKLATLVEYCQIFKLTLPDYSTLIISDTELTEKIGKLEKSESERNKPENIVKREEEKRRREEKKRAKEIEEVRQYEEAFINGESVPYHAKHKFSCTRLRINGEDVQTSLDAFVPIREAKILLQMIRQGKDIKGTKIGNYTVIGINGTLKVGCHEITREEIERFAQMNNW